MQCPEAKCVPANSSQSTGFIEFSEEASHVFSGPMDVGLHLITLQQGGAEHAVIALPTYSFFELSIVGVFSACLAGVAGQREKE